MSTELYKKYRPVTLKGVLGQDGPVSSLQKLIEKQKIPHAMLFTGPSGCGKTTLARIVKGVLDCGEGDFVEINCADFKGIEMVRDIRRYANLAPMSGSCRVWLIDEAHKLTGDAQNAFLKLLEDTPKHVYFMLATTDPGKLIKTIHTRCTEVKLSGMSAQALEKLLKRVIGHEELKVSEDVITEIVEASDNSARKALVILQQIGDIEGDEEQIKAVQASSIDKDVAIELARLLINPRSDWKSVAAILKTIKDDPEGVRYLVLGYARSVLLNGGLPRAFKVIDIFSRNFYDSKAAGLAAACYEVIEMK